MLVFTIDSLQGQISPSFFQVPSTDHSVEEIDSPVNTVKESCHKPVETFYHPNPIKDDSSPVSETGIKIRSRQPRDRPSLMNFSAQGTAPRRMRLWMGYGPKSISCERVKGEEHESKPLITQVSSIYSFEIVRTFKFYHKVSELRFLLLKWT